MIIVDSVTPHRSPDRFNQIEIGRVTWPDQFPETQLCTRPIVIMVDMRGRIILHYYNAQYCCPSSNGKRVEMGNMNPFTIYERNDSSFSTLAMYFQLLERVRIYASWW